MRPATLILGPLSDGGSGAVHPLAAAFIARITSPPSQFWVAAYNTFFTTVADILPEFDYFYCLAAPDEQAASLNLVSTNYTLSKVSTPLFRTARGYRSGDTAGSGTALDTGFNPTTGSPLATQNDCHVGYYSLSSNNVTINDLGNTLTTLMSKPTTLTTRLNSSAPFNVSITSGAGHFVAVRTDSANVTTYKDGVSLGVTSNASTTPTNRTHWLCGRNHTSAEYGVRELAFAHGGKGSTLTAAKIARLNFAMDTFLRTVVPVVVTTVADGGGTGLIQAAVDAAQATGPSQIFNRRLITIGTGVYNEVDVLMQNWIDLRGAGPANTEIRCWQAADADLTLVIAQNSALNVKTSNIIENLTATVKNGRYAVHADSSNNSAFINRVKIFRNCVLIHYGNQEVIDFRGSAAGVWDETNALGGGSSSGETFIMENCAMTGVLSGFAFHTVGDTASFSVTGPETIALRSCTMTGTYSMYIRPFGSLYPDTLQASLCDLDNKPIYYAAERWYADALSEQPADHSEIKMTLAGCTNIGAMAVTEWGRALKIAATSATGTVEVLSDAGLMGTVYTVSNYVYGWADISGHVVGPNADLLITSLGKRLGDCSSVNKTLLVKVNGTPIPIVFTADHTADTNATILGLINTALTGVATASEYNVGALYTPTLLAA